MKADNNITLFVGEQPGSSLTTEGAGKKQEDRKTIFAGDLNQQGDSLQDRIEQKKKEAQKQALKVVSDAFAGDKAIDDDMESRRQKIEELKEDCRRIEDEKAGIAARRENLEKAYEAGEISPEDYTEEKENLDNEQKARVREMDENETQIMQENATIRETRIERLKYHTMVDARNQAEEIMEAARDEIISMVGQESVDHLDEEAEKREEQAAEIKEEREEQEERIEEQKEHREEQEELLEDVPMEEMLSLDRLQSDVKQEVQNILEKMKLVAEDIKGAVVDESR